MRKLLKWIAQPALRRRGMTALLMLGATVAAFYWGRMGGAARLDAQQPQPRPNASVPPSGVPSDYAQRVVAYIYDNMPITREELGEYLIARFGAERLDFLVNRRIVELNCQAKAIYVTDQEVDTQFLEDLKGFGANMTPKDFTNQILKRFNKTLYEWKEDVIRPRLLLSKLCRPMVEVTQKDLAEAFEARYGPKVQCRMIAFAKNDPHAKDIWTKVNGNEAEFAKQAKAQFIPALQAKGGEIPPIHKHFGDLKVEEAAFSLRPGEITALLEMKEDGTQIILKCDKHIIPDNTVTFESKRAELYNEMKETKLAAKITEYFAELRQKAHPNLLITRNTREEDLIRQVRQDLGATSAPPRPLVPSGN
jgi:hypothetical protein